MTAVAPISSGSGELPSTTRARRPAGGLRSIEVSASIETGWLLASWGFEHPAKVAASTVAMKTMVLREAVIVEYINGSTVYIYRLV